MFSAIFDLDGVLVDSEALIREAFEHTFRSVVGSGDPPTAAFLEHMGEAFDVILATLGLPLAMWEPFREYSRVHLDRVRCDAEVGVLLERLRRDGFGLAVLTGKDRERTLEILDRFRLVSHFDAVVTCTDVRRSKPDPEGVRLALEQLDCPPEHAAVIGDSPNDIVAAQRAGVTSIGVTWGIHGAALESMADPDHVVSDWSALGRLLDRLASAISPAKL